MPREPSFFGSLPNHPLKIGVCENGVPRVDAFPRLPGSGGGDYFSWLGLGVRGIGACGNLSENCKTPACLLPAQHSTARHTPRGSPSHGLKVEKGSLIHIEVFRGGG